VAVGVGLAAAVVIVCCLPGWAAHPRWHRKHSFGLVFGTMLGSMAAGFIGFLGATPADLYFKLLADFLAVVLMLALGSNLRRSSDMGTNSETHGLPGRANG
jgi:hypothetical protein